MALIPGGALEIVGADGALFTNTLLNDFIIRTTQVNQRLVYGTVDASNASFILSQSNVGINKNPTVSLDVAGDFAVSRLSTFGSNINISGHIFPQSNELYDIGSCNLRFRDIYLSGNTIDLGGVKIKRNDAGGITIVDASNAISATSTQKVALSNFGYAEINTSNNNIGINNTNPIRTFDVAGDINFSGQLYQNNTLFIGSRWSSNNTGSNINYSQGRVSVGSNIFPEQLNVLNGNFYASSNAYVMQRLGIAKTNPSTTLDVQGDINFSGNLFQNNAQFIGSRWSSNFTGSNIYYTPGRVSIGTSNFQELFTVNNGNIFGSSNIYAMSRVGIAKSNPATTLDVAGDINFSGQLYQNNTLFIPTRWSSNNTGSNIFYTSGRVSIGSNAFPEVFNIFNGNALIDQSAYIMNKIGVRTTMPAYEMDVAGDINFTGRIFQNGFEFLVGGMTSNELARAFQVAPVLYTTQITSPSNITSFVLTTPGTFNAIPQNAQVCLNGSKLVYINSNSKDYDIQVSYPSLYTTQFIVTFTQPVVYGDIVDITIWPYIPNMNGVFVKNLDFASNIQFSNVGIGLPNPSTPLHVYNSGLSNWVATFENSNVITTLSHSDGRGIKVNTNNKSTSNAALECFNGSNVLLYVRNDGVVGIGTSNVDTIYALNVNGSVNASGEISSASDVRLKTNIHRIVDSLSILKQLTGCRFSFTNDPSQKTHIGFIAQDVEKVLPEVVFSTSDGFLSVAYGNIVALLAESIKEQQIMIEELHNDVIKIKSTLNSILKT